MVTDAAADDPVRAEVERWLHAAVGAVLAAPATIIGGVGRCVGRRMDVARRRLVEPARLVTSLFDLAGGAVPTALSPAPGGRAATVVAAGPPGAAGDPAALPIDEYESLAASQVVARLPALTEGELAAVRQFEAAHRGRRTVLGKIDQLLAPG